MKALKIIALLTLGLFIGQYMARAFANTQNVPKNETVKIPEKTEIAILAAGCFWGVEEYFRKLDGVLTTEVGYAGGQDKKPKYDNVADGKTGHAESLRLVFDPAKISYETILIHFFKMHDPTTLNKQGNDVGSQYRSAIFATSKEQKETASKVMARIEKSKAWGRPLTTAVTEDTVFYVAEDYHQKYLVKHPGGYDNHYVRDLKF